MYHQERGIIYRNNDVYQSIQVTFVSLIYHLPIAIYFIPISYERHIFERALISSCPEGHYQIYYMGQIRPLYLLPKFYDVGLIISKVYMI